MGCYWKSATLFSLLALCQIKITSSDGLLFRSNRPGRSAKTPDLFKKTPDFILSNGYPVEIHEVTTDDGYILTLHRIPYGKNAPGNDPVIKRPVVLIQHGIAGSSDNWVLSGSIAFPFILADSGFDVWLPNTRGNSYSKRHKNPSISDAKYWDFSFHEQGIYDMASSIDYALFMAGQSKLFVVGHSRGTTSGLALLSMRPEYNDKIRLFINFAPVAYLKHAKGPLLQAFVKNLSHRQVKKMTETVKFNAFPGLTKPNLRMRTMLCGKGSPTLSLCVRFLFLMSGFSYDLMNKTIAPSYFTHFPDGGGVKEVLHYIQLAQSDRFAMYDLGEEDNILRYGRSASPEYPLQNIKVPMSFHLSRNDYFVSKEDFTKLLNRIRNVAGVFYVPHPTFNHVDFMWGMQADELVYKPTIALMKKF